MFTGVPSLTPHSLRVRFRSAVVFLFTLNVLTTIASALSRLQTMFDFISISNMFFERVMLKGNGQKNLPLALQHCFKTS